MDEGPILNPNSKAVRTRATRWLGAVLFATAALACQRRSVPKTPVLLFAADQLGYLAPCGCSQHQLGGAARAARFLEDSAKLGPTLFLEGGNLLFDRREVPAEKRDQDRLKALAIADAWGRATVGASGRAAALGPFDRSFGEEFARTGLKALGLLPGPKIQEVGGTKFGILSLEAPPASSADAEALRKEGAEIVLALVQGSLKDAQAWAHAAGADLSLQSGVVDPIQDTDQAAVISGGVPVFRVKDKGRGVLRLSFRIPAGPLRTQDLAVLENETLRLGRARDLETILKADRERLAAAEGPFRQLIETKIAELSARREALLGPVPAPPTDQRSVSFEFHELTDQLPEDPEVAALFTRYTAQVSALNLAAQKDKRCPVVSPVQPHYVGADSCRECHEEAGVVWERSKHRHAYQTLVSKGRQLDLDCIRCHVVGLDQPGGVCRLDQVGARADVQCESCHGMGSVHVQSAGDEPVPVPNPGIQTCLGCHTPENDTHFSPETYASHYLPEILGPGHGKPLK
jgi:Cytochrome c554 and c-prime